jgi:cysteine desulfurase
MPDSDFVYLDYNATTPLDAQVLDRMLATLRGSYGNPSSLHREGRRAKDALLEARETLAGALGAAPREIVFTAGGTEADNLAILGTLAAIEDEAPERRHLVTTKIEHHAVLYTVQHLEKRGYPVTYLDVGPDGRVSPEALRGALRPDTALVSIMLANNETGVLQPVAELAALARAAGARLHTDAVQGFGKVPVDVERLGVDLLSLSAHKFYGPKGMGALYVRSGTPFRPVFRGGGQERSRRPGTENLPGIVGLAEAARRATDLLASEAARLEGLRDDLEAEVLRTVPSSHVNGAGVERTPNTVNFRFDGADGERIVKLLDRAGFGVSTGAACAAGAVAPSHVLLAMGLTREQVQGSIRVSLGRDTREEDARRFAAALVSVVQEQREEARAPARD